MDEESGYSDGEYEDWTANFLSRPGFSQLLVNIPDEFLSDSLSLLDLDKSVPCYEEAISLLKSHSTKCIANVPEKSRSLIFNSASLLYALAHARYVMTPQGLEEIRKKYENGDYGRCPRLLCGGQKMLPFGLSQNVGVAVLRCYCQSCGEIYKLYNLNEMFYIDGCFFGPNFPQMFVLSYPNLFATCSKKCRFHMNTELLSKVKNGFDMSKAEIMTTILNCNVPCIKAEDVSIHSQMTSSGVPYIRPSLYGFKIGNEIQTYKNIMNLQTSEKQNLAGCCLIKGEYPKCEEFGTEDTPVKLFLKAKKELREKTMAIRESEVRENII